MVEGGDTDVSDGGVFGEQTGISYRWGMNEIAFDRELNVLFFACEGERQAGLR